MNKNINNQYTYIFEQVGSKLLKASVLENVLDAILNRMYHQLKPNVLLFVKQRRIQLCRFVLCQNLDKQ